MTDSEKVVGIAAQGATEADLDPGSQGKGNPAPVVRNTPPDDAGGEEVRDPTTGKVTQKAEKAEKAAEKEPEKEPEKAASEQKQAPAELTEYTKFDHPAAQAAVDILKEKGITPAEANKYFAAAVEANDLSKIDVEGLKAAIGPAATTLVMAGVTQFYNEQTAKNKEITDKVYEVIGGEDNWTTLRNWAQAKEKLDPEFKTRVDAVRSMINQGPMQAELGVRELKRLFDADPGTKGLNTNKVTTGDKVDYSGITPLTRAEYVAKLEAAHKRNASRVEIEALHQGRKAGMAAGIR